MDTLARHALEKLLAAGNRAEAGVTSRAAALTATQLADYRALRSLQAKESFETTLKDARARGAIDLVWDDFTQTGFVKRIELRNITMLATFLGKPTASEQVEHARQQIASLSEGHPVLRVVVERWTQLKTTRGLGPQDVQDWVDAVRVVNYARTRAESTTEDLPLRVASARVFNDSKRIEKLASPLDVLLVGDVDASRRMPSDVWQELGMYREEQPVRLAGRVIVKRERVNEVLDTPYTALAATTIRGLSTQPREIISIENLTNFHVEARQRCDENVLLVYTAGMPSPAWRAMYSRLLVDAKPDTQVYHWGDLDEGGFRIAAVIAAESKLAGHTLKPWRMNPDDVPMELRRGASEATLMRMRHFACAAGWPDIGDAAVAAGFTVEQEGLI